MSWVKLKVCDTNTFRIKTCVHANDPTPWSQSWSLTAVYEDDEKPILYFALRVHVGWEESTKSVFCKITSWLSACILDWFFRIWNGFFIVLDWNSGVLDWVFRLGSRLCRGLGFSFCKWFQQFWTQFPGFSNEPFDADHPLADLSNVIHHQRQMDLICCVPVTRL